MFTSKNLKSITMKSVRVSSTVVVGSSSNTVLVASST